MSTPSTPAAAASPDLESRIAALESALGLPCEASPTFGGVEATILSDRVAKLEETVRKQAYRLTHLSRAYDSKVAEIEALQKLHK